MHENFKNIKPIIRLLLFMLLAFSAGCLLSGLFFNRQRSIDFGELDSRYNLQHGRATEIIGQLEGELGRERDINRQLREHNTRAREIAEGLADTSERNVRNLQDAIRLIGEIRAKLKVLENFYVNSDSGNSAD
ncbi:MAG: hypothetical protein FWC03_06935 [Treponema sp.]|nr:hypothetical protein [Treponema sp.]